MVQSNSPNTIPQPKRKRGQFIGGCIAIVLIPILAVVYWFFIRDVEAKENKLQFATPVPQAQIYAVTRDDSQLKFTILETISGTIDISGENFTLQPTADGRWLVQANMQIDGQSTDTGNAFYDAVLKAGLKANEHPYGRFVASSTETFEDVITILEQPVTLVGQLEISGIVNDFTINATISIRDGVMAIRATPSIDLKDFGVNFPEQIGSSEMDTDIEVIARLVENVPPADTGAMTAEPALTATPTE